MSQYKDIPQPADQRNVSQADILTNYRYLSTPVNVAAGIPPGIIPVDHLASGDNVANPTDGFHLQSSYINRTAPSTLVNGINGQSSNGIAYAISSTQSSQHRFYNGVRDYPMTTLYALVRFSIAGSVCTIVGQQYNVSSVTYNSTGNYTVNLLQAMPDVNYLPLVTCDSGSTCPVGCTRIQDSLSYKIIVVDAVSGSFVNPASVSTIVHEYF
jgi:hypothetical protein